MTAIRRQFHEIFSQRFFTKTTDFIRKLSMATKQQHAGPSTSSRETNDTLQKPSIIIVALNLMHRFLCLCIRFVLVKVHGENGPAMPPIDNLLLLESATSIAEKIRTKKVNRMKIFFLVLDKLYP